MTSSVAERPAHYDAPKPQAITTPTTPAKASSPMNSIGEGATPLMYACQQSRDQEVKNILAKKVQQTVVHFRIVICHANCLDQQPGAVRERDRTMKTALHYCAENASLTCADIILAAAPDLVDARDEDGYTPIHLAVIAGNRQLIKFLLNKNADVNSLDYERHSVVHWATVCGEVEALELVLDAGANPSTPDIHGGYPIHYAAQMCGPNSEMGNDVRFGLAVLRKLLAKGVEVNVRDKDGRQPILWAASAGSADAILALVNAGANVEADDKDGLTALHCAASRGHTDCLETLVTLCGAEVDVIDSNGCTALFYAVTLGHADSTQLLLGFGAEPNRQDRKGRTPAHCGAAKGQLETLRILGTHGANLWVRNVKGDYPLHEAVMSGRKDLVRWLLTQRPDAVNSPNNDGRCPLHIAAINNNVEMCKILLDGQALLNPVMRTSKGQLMTPIDAALHRGNRGCAKYLQLHGGVPASKLTDKAARLRGGNQRGAMSETQSEQYTTPEFAATLSLPGGRASLGASPVGEQAAGAINEAGRRMDSRTVQAYSPDLWLEHRRMRGRDPVRLNDDVAIRHVERIDAPLICTHRRFDDESSGEERMRRRRRRRRREHRRTDYVDDVDSEVVEEDSRRRRRGGRRTDDFSDSADSEVRKRRRKRRDFVADDAFSDDSDRRTRRRWKGRRRESSERSDDEEEEVEDNVNGSNWVRNKKRRGGGKVDKSKRRSKSKNESDGSDVEYVRVKRTTIKSKRTKRKTVSDEEEETQIEDSHEASDVEEDVGEEVGDKTKTESEDKPKKKTSTAEVVTDTKDDKRTKKNERSKSKEDLKDTQKVEAKRSTKKNSTVDKDMKKKQASSNKKLETDRKSVEKNKGKISKKVVTRERSTTKGTTEESKDADTTKKSTKRIVKRDVKKMETNGTPMMVDKVVEEITVEEKDGDVQEKINIYKESKTPVSLEDDNGATQTVVTALVHQQEEEVSTEGQDVRSEVSREEEHAEGEEEREGKESLNQDGVDVQVTSEENKSETIGEEEESSRDDKSLERLEEKPESEEQEEAEKDDKELHPSGDAVDDEQKVENGMDNHSEKSIAAENEETKEMEEKTLELTQAEEEGAAEEASKEEEAGETEILNEEKPQLESGLDGDNESKRDENFDEDSLEEKEAENLDVNPEAESAEQTKDEDMKQGDEDDETKSEDKAQSSQVDNAGPQTEDETQELEQDSKGDEEHEGEHEKSEADSKASVQELTISSPLEKDKEVNGESGASTARSRNGGDSSVLLDSGFEPSPRRDKGTTTAATTTSKQLPRSARGPRSTARGRGRGRIPRPCRTDDEQQPVTTVSVTQAVQNSMRKYHLERRIFQELLELKRLQIRAGRANEQVLVKRLVDDYHKAGLTVGMRQYDGVYTFRNFEKYLYGRLHATSKQFNQLRLLQSSDRRLIPRLKSSDDLEKLTAALRRARFSSAYLDDIPDNPILCTHGTHRCHHAAHAYTGIPCAAYITKLNHHNIPKSGHAGTSRSGFLPRIDSSSKGTGRSSAVPRSLRYVDPSRPVTLELSHGSDKQVISLPTEKLDRNKRYYVTFTIKGGSNGSKDEQQQKSEEPANSEEQKDLRHRHAKSL